ncbi:MAG: hypothetical protein LBL93_04265 [Ruminococcus sp.]|jgi:hypothetical protein|nr:hypothetical protein [Ruminococcus sp.]
MRLFLSEIKKIFNLKFLILFGIFWVLMVLLVFGLALISNETEYFGEETFQAEMYDKYGDTLSAEELADYDIPGKIKELVDEGDKRIANSDIFKKYNIPNFEYYLEIRNDDEKIGEAIGIEVPDMAFDEANHTESEISEFYDYLNDFYDKTYDVQKELRIELDGEDVFENFNYETYSKSITERWYDLNSLGNYYNAFEEDPLYNGSYRNSRELLEEAMNWNMPVMKEIAERKIKMPEATLINQNKSVDVMMFAIFMAMFVFYAIAFAVSPVLTTDRRRKVDMLQYSSAVGRKITKIQFAAVITSTLIICLFSYATLLPVIIKLFSKYWGAHLLGYEFGGETILLDITLGQYLILHLVILTVFCISIALISFLLSRHSNTLVGLMLKVFPIVTALFSVYYIFVALYLFYSSNLISQFIHGRLWFPELIVTAIVFVVCTVLGLTVLLRNKKRELY